MVEEVMVPRSIYKCRRSFGSIQYSRDGQVFPTQFQGTKLSNIEAGVQVLPVSSIVLSIPIC